MLNVTADYPLRIQERLYLFCLVSRVHFFEQLESAPLGALNATDVREHGADGQVIKLRMDEVRALLMLHLANEVEQACCSSGAPGVLGLKRAEKRGTARPWRVPVLLATDYAVTADE
jgi:hypothetical protein